MKHLGAAAGIVVVLVGAASAGGASNPAPVKRPKAAACTWGASSVTARFVDGRWVVGTPHTTGCTP
jgi:hypothetical protein